MVAKKLPPLRNEDFQNDPVTSQPATGPQANQMLFEYWKKNGHQEDKTWSDPMWPKYVAWLKTDIGKAAPGPKA